jgi:hypothetical protein
LRPPRYSFRPVVATNELFPLRFPSRQAGLAVQTSDFWQESEVLIGPIRCFHRSFPSRQRAPGLWADQGHGHGGYATSLHSTGFLRRDGTGPVQSWSRVSLAATPTNELFPLRDSFRPVVPTNELFPSRFPWRQTSLAVQNSDF